MRGLLKQINALPGESVLEVYELTDVKRGSQKIQIGCPTWIRTNFQGVLTTSHDCLWLCIHCPLIYTNNQCLQALFVHLWEASGRKTRANHVQEKRLCKLCANQTRPGICANLVQRFWPAVARGWPVARPVHHGRVMAASWDSERACNRF